MNILTKIVEFFDMSEKDIVMFLFFGSLLVVMFFSWLIGDFIKWYQKNEENIIISGEFIVRLLIAPVLALVLFLRGKDKTTRRRRIAYFLYA